jgi:ribose 5-phosphate isomerase B
LKIAIASDHGGFELKEKIYNYLLEKKYTVENFGTHSQESCHYPIYAKKVCEAVLNKNFDRGILICTTGIGMSIMANRHKGIRASLLSDKFSAQMTRKHNNSNVLCLGAKLVSEQQAKELIDIWLTTEFEAGRHQTRIDMFDM